MSFTPFKILPALTLLVLAGCLSDNEDGKDGNGGDGKGNRITVNETSRLLEIIPQSESAPGELIVEEIDEWCEDGERKTETYEWIQNFWIEDKVMLQWEAYDCKAMRLTRDKANATSPLGTWKAGSLYDAEIPEAFRMPFCDDGYEDVEVTFLQDLEITQVITEDKVTNTVSGRVCFAGMFGALLFDTDGEDDNPVVQNLSCESVTLAMDGKTATLESRFRDNRVSMTFRHADTTCTANFPFDLGDVGPLNCSEETPEDEELAAFSACLARSGFLPDTEGPYFDTTTTLALQKKAVGHGIANTLRKALRRAR